MIKTSRIPDIKSAEIQLLCEKTNDIHMTAPLDIYSDLLLANVTFSNDTFKYRIRGVDIHEVPFTISLLHTPTFEPTAGYFAVDTNRSNPVVVELFQSIPIPITVCNHNKATLQYSFSYKRVIGLRQGFLPSNQMLISPGECSSVNMMVAAISVETGSTHNLTASVDDGYFCKKLSLAISVPLPVRLIIILIIIIIIIIIIVIFIIIITNKNDSHYCSFLLFVNYMIMFIILHLLLPLDMLADQCTYNSSTAC